MHLPIKCLCVCCQQEVAETGGVLVHVIPVALQHTCTVLSQKAALFALSVPLETSPDTELVHVHLSDSVITQRMPALSAALHLPLARQWHPLHLRAPGKAALPCVWVLVFVMQGLSGKGCLMLGAALEHLGVSWQPALGADRARLSGVSAWSLGLATLTCKSPESPWLLVSATEICRKSICITPHAAISACTLLHHVTYLLSYQQRRSGLWRLPESRPTSGCRIDTKQLHCGKRRAPTAADHACQRQEALQFGDVCALCCTRSKAGRHNNSCCATTSASRAAVCAGCWHWLFCRQFAGRCSFP